MAAASLSKALHHMQTLSHLNIKLPFDDPGDSLLEQFNHALMSVYSKHYSTCTQSDIAAQGKAFPAAHLVYKPLSGFFWNRQ
jgi:hypothetical protein